MKKVKKKQEKYSYLDKYINERELSRGELKWYVDKPVFTFTYFVKRIRDYNEYKEFMYNIRDTYGRFKLIGSTFYILKHANISKWKRFKLKVWFLFGGKS